MGTALRGCHKRPLQCAAMQSAILLLLQEGMTVLHVAAARGLANMISVLVLLDANIDAKTLVSLLPTWPAGQ